MLLSFLLSEEKLSPTMQHIENSKRQKREIDIEIEIQAIPTSQQGAGPNSIIEN